jgi:hypothetical protein
MEGGIETTEKERDPEGEISIALQPQSEILPSVEFVKVEKNLASLGFFTPSSKRLRNAQEKTFTITTVADGKRLELKGTIIPSAKYGLPITADQDKWIALCKILTDIMRKEGRVTNPVSFTSAEILRLLRQHRHSGKNYREVEEWLDVLFSTTIFSEGVVYLASERRRVKDRFRVFERAVSFGKELPDGKRAEKNYVWFSDWQLQNINSNHLLPIDLEAYRELKNHIAKALVPLLQVWLYATRDEGVFEKRYDELCEILNIQRYRYHSLIVRTLGPSLDELKQFGYLADWQLDRTSDGESYKVIFHHGEKFHRDRRARLNRKRTTSRSVGEQHLRIDRDEGTSSRQEQLHQTERQKIRPANDAARLQPTFDPQLVAEFTRHGITEKKAAELLANLKPGQDVLAQLEFGEQMVRHSSIPIVNPPGFYIRLIQSNTSIPDSFETSARRKAREEKERQERVRRAAEDARQELEWEYDNYCQTETDRYIEENPAVFEAIKDAKWKEDRERFLRLPSEMITTMATHAAKDQIRRQLTLLTFEEFVNRKKQGTEFSLKPVAAALTAESASAPVAVQDTAAQDEAATLSADPLAPTAQTEPAIQPATEPAIPEPMMIELISEPPNPELETDAGLHLA